MRYEIQDEVVYHPVSGELVLLDLRSGEYLGLDEIGSEVWRLLGRGADVTEIAAHLADRYAADRSTVDRDLEAFLADLRDAELIRSTEG